MAHWERSRSVRPRQRARSPPRRRADKKTFVLVHGAWHGGWRRRRVADLLEKKGHKVYTPTLTGLGACSHLLNKDINLTTHFTDIINLIEWENLTDVVLVGHSVWRLHRQRRRRENRRQDQLDRVSRRVRAGDRRQPGASSSQPVREAIAAAIGRGELALKPVPAAVFRVNEADRAWVDGKCTPHPIGTLTDKITVTGGRDKIAKKSYIRAKGYPSIPFDGALAKVKAGSGWKTFEMTAGHDAMVDQPQELTDLLLQVA